MEYVDLTSIAGVMFAATVLAEILTRLAKELKKHKKLIALGICVALGVASRISGIGFADVHWVTFVVTLILAGAGVQVVHDKVSKPVYAFFKPNHPATKRTKRV